MKNLPPPPDNADFWALFDYFWDNGVGRELSNNDAPMAWTADALEEALDFKVAARTIDNWRARHNLPSVPYVHTLCTIIPAKEGRLRKSWSDAFIRERRLEIRRTKEAQARERAQALAPEDTRGQTHRQNEASSAEAVTEVEETSPAVSLLSNLCLKLGAGLAVSIVAAGLWWSFFRPAEPEVANIRICDAPYFDKEINKCSQHVDVYMDGIDEVFLSFDLVNVPYGMAFERWWIRNGERAAGRSSFNDDAWPGYTFWRPQGGLPAGSYVVRVIVDGRVRTQVFTVQTEWFGRENETE
ncbi:MAG: hypothetical protein AAFR71_16810 [Pseudomonadota bacterium]